MNEPVVASLKPVSWMDQVAPSWFVDALFLVALPLFSYCQGRAQYHAGMRGTFYPFQRIPERYVGPCCVVFLLLLIAARHCGGKPASIVELFEFPVCIFLSFWTYARGYEVSQLEWPDPPESERVE